MLALPPPPPFPVSVSLVLSNSSSERSRPALLPVRLYTQLQSDAEAGLLAAAEGGRGGSQQAEEETVKSITSPGWSTPVNWVPFSHSSWEVRDWARLLLPLSLPLPPPPPLLPLLLLLLLLLLLPVPPAAWSRAL